MSGQPGGLSEAIARQLSRARWVCDPAFSVLHAEPAAKSRAALAWPQGDQSAPSTPPRRPKGARRFCAAPEQHGRSRGQESGIPASFMLGQAGHETGWGRSEIRNKDGSTSFNLFGIKAGKGWTGKVAEVTTTEYINGVPRKVVAKFRAYDSYEDSFRDYARLITDNPRYEKPRPRPGLALPWPMPPNCRRLATPQTPNTPGNSAVPSRAHCGPRRRKHDGSGVNHGTAQRRRSRPDGQPGGLADGWQQHCQRQHPRYSRQTVALQTVQGQFSGAGYIGQGWMCAPSCATKASCSPASRSGRISERWGYGACAAAGASCRRFSAAAPRGWAPPSTT